MQVHRHANLKNCLCRLRASLDVQVALNKYLQGENSDLRAAALALRGMHDARFAADAAQALARLSSASLRGQAEAPLRREAQRRPHSRADVSASRNQLALPHSLSGSRKSTQSGLHGCVDDSCTRSTASDPEASCGNALPRGNGSAHSSFGGARRARALTGVGASTTRVDKHRDLALASVRDSAGGAASAAHAPVDTCQLATCIAGPSQAAYRPIQSSLQSMYTCAQPDA